MDTFHDFGKISGFEKFEVVLTGVQKCCSPFFVTRNVFKLSWICTIQIFSATRCHVWDIEKNPSPPWLLLKERYICCSWKLYHIAPLMDFKFKLTFSSSFCYYRIGVVSGSHMWNFSVAQSLGIIEETVLNFNPYYNPTLLFVCHFVQNLRGNLLWIGILV